MISIFILHSSQDFYISACLDESLIDDYLLNSVINNSKYKPKTLHKIKLDVLFSSSIIIRNKFVKTQHAPISAQNSHNSFGYSDNPQNKYHSTQAPAYSPVVSNNYQYQKTHQEIDSSDDDVEELEPNDARSTNDVFLNRFSNQVNNTNTNNSNSKIYSNTPEYQFKANTQPNCYNNVRLHPQTIHSNDNYYQHPQSNFQKSNTRTLSNHQIIPTNQFENRSNQHFLPQHQSSLNENQAYGKQNSNFHSSYGQHQEQQAFNGSDISSANSNSYNLENRVLESYLNTIKKVANETGTNVLYKNYSRSDDFDSRDHNERFSDTASFNKSV